MAEALEQFNTVFAILSIVGVEDTNIARVHFTWCYVLLEYYFNLYKVSSYLWIIQLFFNALLYSFMIANSSGTHSIIELVKQPWFPIETHSNGV